MDIKKIITPVGTFEWPFFFVGDTGYKDADKENPKFKVTYLVEEDKAVELFKTVTSMAEEVYQEALLMAGKTGKRPPKKADLPVYPAGDGKLGLKCHLKQFGVNREGKAFENKVKVWDKNNKPWDPAVAIWSGSQGRLIIEAVPYVSPSFGAGVSLRLREAQVVKLAERQNQVKSGFGSAATHDDEPGESGGFGGISDADFE